MTTYNTFADYNGDGTTTDFAIPFAYSKQEEVIVTFGGVSITYTFPSGSVLRLATALAVGNTLRIARKTALDAPVVTFANGSSTTASQLNRANEQLLHGMQEAVDTSDSKMGITAGQWDAQSKRITHVADPTTGQDAATKNYADTGLTSQLALAVAARAAADADVVLTHADVVLTHADVATTAATAAVVAADKATVIADMGTVAADKAIVIADMGTVAADKAIVIADMATTLSYKNAAAADVVLTDADVLLTHADVALTHADVVLTHADVVLTHADAAAAAASAVTAAGYAVGGLTFIGNWDASAGTFPGGGTAPKGSMYRVSVAGTVNSIPFLVGDNVIAIVVNPSTTTFAGNWIHDLGGINSAEVVAALGFTPPPNTRLVSTGGLATGGGDLSVDRTITVTAAIGTDVTTGTDITKAVTSKAIKDAGIFVAAFATAAQGVLAGTAVQPAGLPIEATNAQMWAKTSTSAIVTPRREGSARAWIALTDAATILVDSTLGRNFKLASMAGNRTLAFPTGTLIEGDEYNYLIKQDATGTRTLAYAAGYQVDGDTAFALGTTPSKYSLVSGLVLPGATMILLQLVAVNFTGP